MTEPSTDDSFEKIVEWAYNTLPEKIRSLPDFPGIQVAEEPTVDVLKDIRERRNWPKESELMGLYSGFHKEGVPNDECCSLGPVGVRKIDRIDKNPRIPVNPDEACKSQRRSLRSSALLQGSLDPDNLHLAAAICPAGSL